MNNSQENEKNEEKRDSRKNRVKSKGPNILQTLGLTQQDQVELEKKLFLVKYLDFFSEQTFNLIFKDKYIEKLVNEFSIRLDSFGTINEEDKLLKQQYEEQQVKEIILRIKSKAEKLAISKGYEKSVEKRFRRLNLMILIPMIGILSVFTILQFVGLDLMMFSLPILCFFCLAPQIIRGTLMKKWFDFKEENKNQLYTENRDDIIILKGYNNELLNNIRSFLLEKKIPLQIIKFQLLSSDYEQLKILGQHPIRNAPGEKQNLVSFEYPAGITPFPIPEGFQKSAQQTMLQDKRKSEKPEKNFIILSELKAKSGVIENFIPSLKEEIADDINEMLNACEFIHAPGEITQIIPNYSPEMAIYCVCGEVAELKSVQICNWNDKFKFYLFEAKACKCGEKIYALSLRDDAAEVPEELKQIFKN